MLDVGCGWRRSTAAAARKGYKVTAVNPDIGFILTARTVVGSYSSTLNEELLWGRLYSLNRKARWLLARTEHPRAQRALANRYMDLAFGAYPQFPAITSEALKRMRELGGTDYVPDSEHGKGELLRHLLGWKAARQLDVAFLEHTVPRHSH